MIRYTVAYIVTAVIFLGIDFIWLSRTMSFYKQELGGLLAEKPDLSVAALFYTIYVAGILMFAIVPAERNGSWIWALLLGAALGLVAYATYDLTNLATLKDWSAKVAIADIVWGTFLTAVSALAGYAAMSLISRNT
ncbi:DUF2177 family protein [Afipia sp. DC4300-2b1]|uniref:DUF2177 family protein n=1 Tax=Afipia sp. DC4300-2b1 TaxID=2804672 RepID=UPI003CF0D8AF